MVYVEIRGFLDDVFKGRGKEILQDGMSHSEIVDIDDSDKEKRKIFADFLLKHHFHFSAQKNRLLYEQMLNILEIGTEFDLKDYRKTVKETHKDENIILSSLTAFWTKIEKAYSKYEVILNLFWLKGVEAEMRGKDKAYVTKIINKALSLVRRDIRAAHESLLKDLDLLKYQKHKKPSLLKIKLFDDMKFKIGSKVPDKEAAYLISTIEALMKAINESASYIERHLMKSMDEDLLLKQHGGSDKALIENLRTKLVNNWKSLKDAYYIIYKKMEKEFI